MRSGAGRVARKRVFQSTLGAAVLKAMGITVSDAARLIMVRIAADKALPFEPLTPNAKTIEAMRVARRGEVIAAGKPEYLLASLNADD